MNALEERRWSYPARKMVKWALRQAKDQIPDHPGLNEVMVAEHTTGKKFHGCKLPHRRERDPDDPVFRPFDDPEYALPDRRLRAIWQCRFPISGIRLCIGRGTLYQCARIHDAATLRFAHLRLYEKPPVFNFTRDSAESDLKTAPFMNLFSALEAAWELTTSQ
jgi:hypothetical protein